MAEGRGRRATPRRRARRRPRRAIARRSRLRHRAAYRPSAIATSWAPWEQNDPLVQRTNGSWYHLLVRRPGSVRSSRAAVSGALSTLYRASPVAARERPSRRRSRTARTIPRSLRGHPDTTLPGHRREGGSVARTPGRPDRDADG